MAKSKEITKTDDDYGRLLSSVVALLETARRAAARSVDSVMTMTYWDVGRRIVEHEQSGKKRAGYGDEALKRLSEDLTSRFGRGFAKSNLYQMRNFFLTYSNIFQTPSGKLDAEIFQTPSGISEHPRFPLSWSHYVELLSAKSDGAREFYEAEALRGGWTIRQLKRQIGTQFYERTLLSKNKTAMLTKGAKPKPEDLVIAEEEIKDPFRLEFLGLKDEYSESDLEEALILHLESFLLELGGDFAFIGRQKRLRVGDEWFRVDLVFFHRRLKCLILIDLKLNKFSHADVGQMNLYCNYAAKHWTHEDENPPVGLILCAGKNEAMAEYAMGGITNKILTSEYQTALPDRKLLETELRKTREILERRGK